MSAERKQSGLAHDYTEWAIESTTGQVPTDPDFKPISDNLRTVWDGEPDASTEPQRGLGSRDPKNFFNGPEEHEFTFTYDLQQWYVDSSGNVQDPAGETMLETADNDIKNTHTVVTKESHVSGGPDGGGRYIFTVGVGGYPSELTVPFETEDGLPVAQELSYRFEKVREYSIGQPSSSSTLAFKSTDADDTMDVTIENDDGSANETLTLSGTTVVESSSTYSSIAAVYLNAESVGNIEFGISDGGSPAAIDVKLGEIKGSDAYDGIEGDRGVPAIGSGSHATSLNSEYIRFRRDRIQYSGGADIAPEISSGELTIDNGISASGQDESVRMSIDVGQRETSFTASLAGPKVTFDQITDYLTQNATTVEWLPNDSTVGHQSAQLSLDNARLVTPGGQARETDSAKMIVESEWQSEGVTVQ